ncbi:MAG: phage/plasmid primase, P4 family [Roseovarius sp.]
MMNSTAAVIEFQDRATSERASRVFCTGFGQSDTHAPVLNDGRDNPHKSAGQPYGAVTGRDIVQMVEAPASVPKERAQWFIPSSYCEADARSHDAQREHGCFWWLTLDIDENNLPLSDVVEAVEAVAGGCRRVIYSSRSAAPDNRKWRVLLPLLEPLSGQDYTETQRAFFDLLEDVSDGALIPDRGLERPGQLIYLPNRGDHYEFDICKSQRLFLDASHPITQRREESRRLQAEAEAEARAERDRKAAQRATRAANDGQQPVDHFNAAHTVEQLLGHYGYKHLAGTDDWRSPMQTSGSHATRCYGDYWVSLSASDAAADIGRETKSGHRTGDAFDLYVHFEHDGDFTGAVRAYAKSENLGRDQAGPTGWSFGSNVGAASCASNSGNDVDHDLSHDALATDIGLRDFDQNARHVAIWGKWLFWTGTRWEPDEKLGHLTRTRAFLRKRANELLEITEQRATRLDQEKGEGEGDKLRRWAREQARALRSKVTVAAVESLARSNPASVAGADDFDGDAMLLGTPGGTVDLRNGRLRDAQPSDKITKLTACAPAPKGEQPELWLRFLNDVFAGDQEVIAFMQRAAGYALTGQTTEHKLLFLYGTGRNGKSVYLNTLFELWGGYARRAAAETFLNSAVEKHSTGLAGLQGARLVAGSELPVGKTWDESTIKDLTGGDVMTARYMRGDFFDFVPQLTLMIAGNNQPSFRGVDEAIRARVVLIPFTVTIPAEKRDPDLPAKLKTEGPKILRWAIDGAVEWKKRGLDVPASVAAASEEYMDDEDMLGQFLADETAMDPNSFVTTADLHQRFNFWCERQGLHAWTQNSMRKELKSRGFRDHRKTHGRGFVGLELR